MGAARAQAPLEMGRRRRVGGSSGPPTLCHVRRLDCGHCQFTLPIALGALGHPFGPADRHHNLPPLVAVADRALPCLLWGDFRRVPCAGARTMVSVEATSQSGLRIDARPLLPVSTATVWDEAIRIRDRLAVVMA